MDYYESIRKPAGAFKRIDFISPIFMKTFIGGLGAEFQKIVWPKGNEAFGIAALVIVVAVLVGYYLGLFDALFAMVLKAIIG
jgi:preprotein translocase SecE subunit